MLNNSIFSKDLCTYMKLEFKFIFMTFCFNLKELRNGNNILRNSLSSHTQKSVP